MSSFCCPKCLKEDKIVVFMHTNPCYRCGYYVDFLSLFENKLKEIERCILKLKNDFEWIKNFAHHLKEWDIFSNKNKKGKRKKK